VPGDRTARNQGQGACSWSKAKAGRDFDRERGLIFSLFLCSSARRALRPVAGSFWSRASSYRTARRTWPIWSGRTGPAVTSIWRDKFRRDVPAKAGSRNRRTQFDDHRRAAGLQHSPVAGRGAGGNRGFGMTAHLRSPRFDARAAWGSVAVGVAGRREVRCGAQSRARGRWVPQRGKRRLYRPDRLRPIIVVTGNWRSRPSSPIGSAAWLRVATPTRGGPRLTLGGRTRAEADLPTVVWLLQRACVQGPSSARERAAAPQQMWPTKCREIRLGGWRHSSPTKCARP